MDDNAAGGVMRITIAFVLTLFTFQLTATAQAHQGELTPLVAWLVKVGVPGRVAPDLGRQLGLTMNADLPMKLKSWVTGENERFGVAVFHYQSKQLLILTYRYPDNSGIAWLSDENGKILATAEFNSPIVNVPNLRHAAEFSKLKLFFLSEIPAN